MRLDDPSQVDAWLNNTEIDRLAALEAIERSDLWIVRRLQLAIAEHDIPAMHDGLMALPDLAPSRGVELLARASLGDLQSTSNPDLTPRGFGPLEGEESCLQHLVAGVVAAQAGQFEQAYAMNQTAMYLARALNLHNRAQSLEIELARLATLKGKPMPDRLQAHLLAPMPELRRHWGQRTLAESHMALGNFTDALRVLGSPSHDTEEDAPLREFILAMLDLPAQRPEGHPLLPPQAAYVRLVNALRSMKEGRRSGSLADIHGEPQATYAVLIEAATLARTPKFGHQAQRMLESLTPTAPDQRFFRTVGLFGSVMGGQLVKDAHLLPEQLRLALEDMARPTEPLMMTRRNTPMIMAMLILGPTHAAMPARLLNLNALPLLTGKTLQYGGEKHAMPGRAGRYHVREALGIMEDKLQRVEQRRFTDALHALGLSYYINLGQVAQGVERMMEAFRRVGLPAQAAAWRQAHERIIEMLDPDVLPKRDD